MRRFAVFACVLLVSLAWVSLGRCAQTQSVRPAAQAPVSKQPVSSATQWEYLVVSFGKAYFTDPLSSEAKEAGLSKVRAFTEAGMLMADEATDIQSRLDKLGQFGWELVGVVGAIGGDQEFILKRQYDPARSEKETELVQAEGKRLRQVAAELAAKQATETAEALVDMDAVEKAARDESKRSELEKQLREVISSGNYSLVDMHVPVKDYVMITIDGSSQLLKDGNKYRASEARSLAQSIVTGIATSLGLTSDILKGDISRGDVYIEVIIDINYQTKLHPVGYSSGLYYYARR